MFAELHCHSCFSLLDGAAITTPHEKIGIIFQEPRLLPWLTVAGNVGFGIEGRRKAERNERVAHALERVGLSEKADVWPRELSGGQAQRGAIARALVPRPEVLLLDEPFSALDAFTRVDLQDHLLNLWAEFKPTLVLVTHDVEEAIALADRIVVMSDGAVIADDTPRALLAGHADPAVEALMQAPRRQAARMREITGE